MLAYLYRYKLYPKSMIVRWSIQLGRGSRGCWLLLAFLVYPALSAYFLDAELAVIPLPKINSKLVAHIVYSREH
jgi:hypothetical protein